MHWNDWNVLLETSRKENELILQYIFKLGVCPLPTLRKSFRLGFRKEGRIIYRNSKLDYIFYTAAHSEVITTTQLSIFLVNGLEISMLGWKAGLSSRCFKSKQDVVKIIWRQYPEYADMKGHMCLWNSVWSSLHIGGKEKKTLSAVVDYMNWNCFSRYLCDMFCKLLR